MTDPITPPSASPEAAIQQLNLRYHLEEDRLLLRVGLSDDSELKVWLTMRITKQLWALLNGDSHFPTANSIQIEAPPQQALQQFQQEAEAVESLKKMDFTTEYQPRKQVLNQGALLATALQLKDDGIKCLEITCLEGLNIRMNLTYDLILALCNMLHLSCKEANWDIGEPVSKTLIVDTDMRKVLH